jgi:hypothetical protein
MPDLNTHPRRDQLHNLITEVMNATPREAIQRGLLNVDDAELSRRRFPGDQRGDVGRGLHGEGGAEAKTEVRLVCVEDRAFQLRRGQLFPKVNDGIVEIPAAVLALSTR